ncbi:MAG: hypothetical protein HY006_03515 [Candidatus Sungbacteria bacterium]|nr:hypothetical protein [Candidatus Sungbacteria bacterium]
MEQRTSVMISAILFAVVVAGSIAYLLYSNPSVQKKVATASPTPSPETIQTVSPTPEAVLPLAPTPTPDFVLVPTTTPEVAAAITPSAPTGPADILLLMLITFSGAAGLVVATRNI